MACFPRIGGALLMALLFALPAHGASPAPSAWDTARAVMADFDLAWTDAGIRFGQTRTAGDQAGQAMALQDLERAVAHALDSLPQREDCMGLWWDASYLRLEAWASALAAYRATDAGSPARNHAYGSAASGLYAIAPYLAAEVEC